MKATPEMIAAGAEAARKYMAETGGNSPAVIWDAMWAAKPAQQEPVAWVTKEDVKFFNTSIQGEGAFLYQKNGKWNIPLFIGPQPAQQINPETRTKAGLKYSPNYVAGYNDGLKAAQPSKPLTDEQIDLFINGRGDEGDADYVEPTGDGFGLTDADLVKLVRRVEAAHGIKENK